MTVQQVIPKLREAHRLFETHGLDAIVASTRQTLHFLSGVDISVAGKGEEERTWVVWTPERLILLAPDWFDPWAAEVARDDVEVQFFCYPAWPSDALVTLLRELGLGEATVGVEAQFLPMSVTDKLRSELPGIKLTGIDDDLGRCRGSKTPEEIAHMRAASTALELAMVDAVAASKVGITEREFAQLILRGIINNGAEEIAWLAIRWGDDIMRMTWRDVPIRPGELINIEVGCTVNGYYSDLQRMVAATPVSDEIAAAYRQIHGINEKTMLGIRPGMTALGVYEMYVENMREAGLEDWSAYYLGHGIGLYPHEGDLLSAGSSATSIVPDHSFFAIEPAITKPALLSVEDTVYVTSAGNEIISSRGDWSELVVLGQRVQF